MSQGILLGKTGTFIFICGNFSHEVITLDEKEWREREREMYKRVTALIRHGHLLTKYCYGVREDAFQLITMRYQQYRTWA